PRINRRDRESHHMGTLHVPHARHPGARIDRHQRPARQRRRGGQKRNGGEQNTRSHGDLLSEPADFGGASRTIPSGSFPIPPVKFPILPDTSSRSAPGWSARSRFTSIVERHQRLIV